MDRRASIRTMLYIAGGTLVLPACFRPSGRTSIELVHLKVSEDDEALLEALVETLIPATDTPGGRKLMLHLFALKMVDDCHGPEEQQAFVDGVRAFADWSRNVLGSAFVEAEKEHRENLLKQIGEAGDAAGKFFSLLKRRAIQGYMNSKYVMTNLVKYELVPGRYDGYFPMETTDGATVKTAGQ
ncbi:gluconate 2-dehydrogenase subunit 3 family protein [Parapedobacter sp. 10938]|uniref:gluconate 2-dehydrogenase subunit 3 family protein n=1 Tax=Parapedobacter flavus TaxID=3110225 RepID=UPI002DB5FF32|nr:gluconate 2-dehydrogenase subunit 3 family protein [Parapedobacter sp. 10938]MEC3879445.1 gluconate 2-dehydrogenase subunit 3 family protein [Parapedobacter sp. 10938]